jgi:hypothetical protein
MIDRHPLINKYRRSEMKKQDRAIPFGLLFEEIAPHPQGLITPTYDEEMDLSYVKDSQGHRVPYVEFSGATSTETETRIRGETTDRDLADDNAWFCEGAGTQTITFVEAEPTDEDPGDNQGYSIMWRFLASTDTFTKEEKESTDQD